MRITKEHVRTVSAYARALSNNYVAEAEFGTDLGAGSRIMDGNSQVVWLGQPREAAAYYIGQVDAFADARGVILADYPPEVAEVRSEVRGSATVRVDEWYSLGVVDGKSRTKHYCPEIKGAGVPESGR